jgi:hypothetical protein
MNRVVHFGILTCMVSFSFLAPTAVSTFRDATHPSEEALDTFSMYLLAFNVISAYLSDVQRMPTYGASYSILFAAPKSDTKALISQVASGFVLALCITYDLGSTHRYKKARQDTASWKMCLPVVFFRCNCEHGSIGSLCSIWTCHLPMSCIFHAR